MNIFQGGYHDTQRFANECKGPRPCGAMSDEICNGKVFGFHQYKRDVERCQAKRAKEAEDIAERNKKGWTFKCGKCGKRFQKQRNLSDHRLRCNKKVCSNSKENHCVPKGGLLGQGKLQALSAGTFVTVDRVLHIFPIATFYFDR